MSSVDACAPAERLIEVLLEEEFARLRVGESATRPAAAPRRLRAGMRWLAAALVLLGLGTAFALMRTAPEPLVSPLVPTGTDPADLAAIRSAEQMLAAEQKLAAMVAAGQVTGHDEVVTFEQLSDWRYQSGLRGVPQRIVDLGGKKVLMAGFMLPIDEVQDIREFLLVKSLWGCCFGKPPDIHGIVRVVMPEGRTTDYCFDPLKVIGTLRVEATVKDGYCVDIYQLQVESLEVIKP